MIMVTGRCPKCNSTRYRVSKEGKKCLKCGYVNDPNYFEKLERKNGKIR